MSESLLYLLLFHPLRQTHLSQTGLGLGHVRVAGVDGDLYVVSLLGVSLTGGPLDESHSTARRGTDEGLLSSVKAAVVVESVPLGEGPATELTAVLLHPGVHVHVVLLTVGGQSDLDFWLHFTHLETGAPVEPLAALLTDVGLDTGVLHGVELQLAPIMEGRVAVFTRELLAQLRIVNVELVFLGQLERDNVGRDSLYQVSL